MNRRDLLRYFLPVAAAAPLALKAAFDDKALILPPPTIEIPERCTVVSPRGRCVNFCAPGRHVCVAHDERITVRLVQAYDPLHDLMLTRFDALFGELPPPRGVQHVAVVRIGHGEMVTFRPPYHDELVQTSDPQERVARLRAALGA